jgi:hypothetical protein
MTQDELRIEKGELRKGNLQSPISILNILSHALIFIVAVVAYTATMNGDVQPADSGEFQIAAITLGIPHPPGYPLFTLLGWLFAQAPIGSPFARVTFLSVIASALTLVFVSLTVVKVLNKWMRGQGDRDPIKTLSPSALVSLIPLLAGLVAAIALGTSTTFWAQATTTNIRSLTALFTALMLYASARGYATHKASSLTLFALALGLGVGHHVSLVFIGAVLGGYLLLVAWRFDRVALPRALVNSALVFAAMQLVWLYLPLRDATGARFAPGNLGALDGLLFHVFARGFAGDMLAFAAPQFLFDRLALLPTLLEFQFSLPLLIGAAVGAGVLIWRRVWVAVAWLIAFALHLFITVTYRAPQTVEYALPCWVIASALLGAGLGAIANADQTQDARRKNVLRLASCVLLVAALEIAVRDGAARWPSYAYLSTDRSTRANAESVLRYAQSGDAILSQWHQATPMWALQDVEGMQRNVQVDYVYPRGAQPYAETFAEQAARSAQEQLTYVTSLFEREFAAQGLQAFPLPKTPAWRADKSIPVQGRSFPQQVFDGRLHVIGSLGIEGDAIESGAALPVDVGWYTSGGGIQPSDSISVRIMRPDGRLAANADIQLSPDDARNDMNFRRVVLGIPLDLPPGPYDVLVGAYRAADGAFISYKNEDGDEFASVTRINVTPSALPPATQHPLGEVTSPIGEQPRLIGVDYDTGIPDQMRVWTHWQLGARPMTVSVADADGAVLAGSKDISAATVYTQPQYLSLPFDVPPALALRLTTGQHLPDVGDGERYVPFANQMTLTGSNSHRDGASLKLDLNWLAARPLVNDYIVSARVEGNGLYRAHDGVPALGAVPTLKWIRGSRVTDRHPFDLGEHAGDLRGTVVVYDSASQLPLPPLDERYENGVTIPIN